MVATDFVDLTKKPLKFFKGFFFGAPCMADNSVVKVHYGGM
jgi:hypothetical protein